MRFFPTITVDDIPFQIRIYDPTAEHGMKEEHLKLLFQIMDQEVGHEIVFWDNCVWDDDGFVDIAKHGNPVFAIFADQVPMACLWLTGHEGKTYRHHFFITRACKQRMIQVECGLAMMRYLTVFKDVDGSRLIESLVGVVPIHYRHVANYGRKLGFKILGVVPGLCYIAAEGRHVDGIISVLNMREV